MTELYRVFSFPSSMSSLRSRALCLWWSTRKISSRTICSKWSRNAFIWYCLFTTPIFYSSYMEIEKLLNYLLKLNIHLQFNILLVNFEMFFFFSYFSLWVLCLEKFKVELNCSKWAELTSPDFVGNKLEFIWNKQI